MDNGKYRVTTYLDDHVIAVDDFDSLQLATMFADAKVIEGFSIYIDRIESDS